jgi:hypothetical protein
MCAMAWLSPQCAFHFDGISFGMIHRFSHPRRKFAASTSASLGEFP